MTLLACSHIEYCNTSPSVEPPFGIIRTMSSRSHKLDLTHFAPSGLPTPDAMMMALLEQQQLLADKDEALAESASRIQNQKNQIAVLQEQIKLLKMQKYASKSEQNLLQKDFFADEAETLADGENDANDGEIDEPEEKLRRAPRKKSGKKPLSPPLCQDSWSFSSEALLKSSRGRPEDHHGVLP